MSRSNCVSWTSLVEFGCIISPLQRFELRAVREAIQKRRSLGGDLQSVSEAFREFDWQALGLNFLLGARKVVLYAANLYNPCFAVINGKARIRIPVARLSDTANVHQISTAFLDLYGRHGWAGQVAIVVFNDERRM